jgi:hypothetical protein
MIRNAVTGEPLPPLRNADAIRVMAHDQCMRDTIYRSRCRTWLDNNPGSDSLDFFDFIQKGHRDAGSMPDGFASLTQYVAWILELPEPKQWKDQ